MKLLLNACLCRWKYLFVAALFLLPGCGEVQKGSENSSNSKEEWVTEEVLQQLVDLQRTVSELQKDVVDLDSKVASLRGGGLGLQKLTKVEFGEGVALGNADAQIAIVEFMDYQCPFCVRHARKVLPQIKKELIDTGAVKYIIRDFPLSSHSKAKGAAIAVACAGEQNKYWQMHEQLISGRGQLGRDFYSKTAKSLGLALDDFNECLSHTKHEIRINQNLAYGKQVGVTGTPKFYVGIVSGNTIVDVQVISGAQSFEVFSRTIKSLAGRNVKKNKRAARE